MSEKNFYLTTPIYYVNDIPHIGHAYTTIAADVMCRHMRMRGDNVFFLTGTDEHGLNIERAAEAAGLAPQPHVDAITARFQRMVEDFHLSPDRFIRTTDPAHERGAQHLYTVLRENGHLYKGTYTGWFCGGCNQYYAEAEVLIRDGQKICPTHERPLDWLEEESWFFRLSSFQERLLAHYEAHPGFIRPRSRANEVLSFVRAGLQDISVSRAAVKWGVPVPGDPDHTLYVWLDALSNYITALGYGNQTYQGLDRFWPATVQLVGKDILRFHTVYWPAFLMGAGLPLPQSVFAHGMWMSGGRKMSKSLGNVIDLADLRAHFELDSVRYFCLREMAFGEDADFNYPALISRINGDLAGGLGNLCSRSLTLVKANLGGVLPALQADLAGSEEVRQTAERVRDLFIERMNALELHRALEGAWELVGATDRFIARTAPWALAKDPARHAELGQVLAVAAEALRFLTALLQPVMPEKMASLWTMLGLAGAPAAVDPASLAWGGGPARAVGEVSGLFPRLDEKKLMGALAGARGVEAASPPAPKAAKAPKAPEAPPYPPPAYTPAEGADASLDYETFLRTDIRVGQVLVAEAHPRAERLLRLEVDLGEAHPRQICAGLAEAYRPEELVGQRVLVVANLAPRKLRGLDSQGMVLAADDAAGRPRVVHPPADLPLGSRLR